MNQALFVTLIVALVAVSGCVGDEESADKKVNVPPCNEEYDDEYHVTLTNDPTFILNEYADNGWNIEDVEADAWSQRSHIVYAHCIHVS